MYGVFHWNGSWRNKLREIGRRNCFDERLFKVNIAAHGGLQSVKKRKPEDILEMENISPKEQNESLRPSLAETVTPRNLIMPGDILPDLDFDDSENSSAEVAKRKRGPEDQTGGDVIAIGK